MVMVLSDVDVEGFFLEIIALACLQISLVLFSFLSCLFDHLL